MNLGVLQRSRRGNYCLYTKGFVFLSREEDMTTGGFCDLFCRVPFPVLSGTSVTRVGEEPSDTRVVLVLSGTSVLS